MSEMCSSNEFLNPSEAALRLGVSIKALRLCEQRGLLTGAHCRRLARIRSRRDEPRREIAALRGLGLSLAQVAAC